MPQITLIPGDGIGPEITDATQQVLDASGADITWDLQAAGQAAYNAGGSPLPDATVDSIRRNRVALKGPCATQIGVGFRSINVALRKEFELYANVRPARSFAGVPSLFPNLDIVVVRENIEGLYTSMEHWIDGREAAMGIGVNTRSGMERICKYAFEYAVANGRKKVCAVHKANILKILSGLFLEVARETAKQYPQIEFQERIVDAMAMQMVRNPYQFEVIVTTNLFGDILSDLAAGLIGGLGVAPGANIGEGAAIFEAVHGTAPDIAGQDLANPASLILAGVLMLRHIGERDAAGRVETALTQVFEERKFLTRDLDPEHGVGTRAMTEAILSRL